MPDEDQTFAEKPGYAEGSRYYEVHTDVPEAELKVTPPSPMPAELHGLEAHHLIQDVSEEDVQP